MSLSSSSLKDLETYLLLLQSLVIKEGGSTAPYRKKAYQTAIDLVRGGDDLSDIDVRKIPGIGDRMRQRILYFYGRADPVDEQDEIALQQVLSDGDDAREEIEILQLFQSVEGVGPVTAQKWYDLGYRTIDELLANPPPRVTAKQMSGLEHHATLIQRIPREDIEEFERMLKDEVPSLIFTIAGSYRREKATSGDIDIIVVIDNNEEEVNRLIDAIGFIDILASGEKKINGIANVAGVPRRVDIEFTPPEQYPLALLYFTGSKDFNRRMRGIANQYGFHLEEKHLSTPYRAWIINHNIGENSFYLRDRLKFLRKEEGTTSIFNTNYLTEEEKIYFEETRNIYYVEVFSEEEVFELLGMEWQEPRDRDV